MNRTPKPGRLPASLSLLLLLSLTGCDSKSSATGGGEPGPSQPIVVRALSAPAEVEAGESAAVNAEFYLGSDTCWSLGDIGIERDGPLLRLEGEAVYPPGNPGCGDALTYGIADVPLPALPAGDYTIVAGNLHLPLTVTATVADDRSRAAFLGSVELESGDCGIGWIQRGWGFIGLPSGIDRRPVLVEGFLTGEDPCGFPEWFHVSTIIDVESVTFPED